LLVDETSRAELRGESKSKNLFESTLVMVVAVDGGIVNRANIDDNVTLL